MRNDNNHPIFIVTNVISMHGITHFIEFIHSLI